MLSYGKCKQLKEAGFPQDIYLCYQIEENEYLEKKAKGTYLNPFHEEQLLIPTWTRQRTKPVWWSNKEKEVNFYACPSFEEIWTQLPECIPITITYPNQEDADVKFYYKTLTVYAICYLYQRTDDLQIGEQDFYIKYKNNNIAEAAADLWLLLKKEGLINA
mgnify:CR=1 FL=1